MHGLNTRPTAAASFRTIRCFPRQLETVRREAGIGRGREPCGQQRVADGRSRLIFSCQNVGGEPFHGLIVVPHIRAHLSGRLRRGRSG